MQCGTHRQAPASTRLKWVSHRKTLLARVLTRACVLLSFVCALARRVVTNLLEHHKKFYHGHPIREARHYQSRRRD